MKNEKYAVIVWRTPDTFCDGHGTVYGWYEALATTVVTASDLMRNGTVYHAVAVKCL